MNVIRNKLTIKAMSEEKVKAALFGLLNYLNEFGWNYNQEETDNIDWLISIWIERALTIGYND